MKIHSTHYFDPFIEVAEDTKGTSGQYRQQKTGAEMKYEIIAKNSYKFNSDDISFKYLRIEE
ncbi:MAG TPA: DUF6157 family protein [Saprospiraceae bacterium]|nr:DUF6157 family protein [Saprospiraceae bacterium]